MRVFSRGLLVIPLASRDVLMRSEFAIVAYTSEAYRCNCCRRCCKRYVFLGVSRTFECRALRDKPGKRPPVTFRPRFHELRSRGANTSAMDDRGRIPKRLASRKEISNLLAAKEMESKARFIASQESFLRSFVGGAWPLTRDTHIWDLFGDEVLCQSMCLTRF